MGLKRLFPIQVFSVLIVAGAIFAWVRLPARPPRAQAPSGSVASAVSAHRGREAGSRSEAAPKYAAKAEELREILASRNDNDPRLDRDFNSLSENAKAELRALYASFAAEKRDSRGTVVYLLGRNLGTSEDFRFLSRVLGEPECRSLADCSSSQPDDPEFSEGNAVTRAYPQLMALKAIERYLRAHPDGTPGDELDPQAWDALQAGENSPSDAVSRMARATAARLRERGRSG